MMTQSTCQILVVGVGNVLQGDDGFGVELANRLMERTDIPEAVKIIETGIGGMTIVQELMLGYQALLILDAYKNKGQPGQLYLLEPVIPDLSHLKPHELRDYFSDTHYATPMRALNLLSRVGELPETINIVGCEPEQIDDMKLGLSEAVSKAVPKAEIMAIDWINKMVDSLITGSKLGTREFEEGRQGVGKAKPG